MTGRRRDPHDGGRFKLKQGRDIRPDRWGLYLPGALVMRQSRNLAGDMPKAAGAILTGGIAIRVTAGELQRQLGLTSQTPERHDVREG